MRKVAGFLSVNRCLVVDAVSRMSEQYAVNCQHCWKGIGYETWYFVCLFCDLIVCNDCHGNHPQSHIQWFRHRRTRMMPRGANPELAECQKCMKMVHCRIQCAQCAVAFCSGCISRDARSCLENHEHRVDELVPPPEMGVLEIREPCRTCPSKGSTAHCGRCGQGVEDGQVWTECFTCERLYGAAAAFCPSCLPRGREEHDPAHEWGSVQHAYKPSTDDPGWFEWKCLECQQTIDVAISNSLRKHAHNNFLFSYGRDVRQQVVKRNWKACANKPVRHDDAANEELLSKSSAKCCLCGSCFLNLGKICMCLTCRTTYCVHCFERGPGKLHEHYCVQLYINCEKPPNHLYQLAQAICQRSCAMCRGSINLWRSMSLSCVTCKDWFICQSCIVGMGPNICHACPKASKSELLLNDTYPMEDKWWSQQTVLLSRQVDPDTMPLTFVVATQCYDKKDADEMSVLPGDRIMVTPYSHYTDWYQGRNDWTGQSGIFPTWCVLIDADAVQVAREQDWLASGAHPCRTSPSASAPSPSRDGEVEATTAKMNVWANALKLGTAVVDAFSSK